MTTVPFEYAVVREPGGERWMTREEFRGLALDARVRLILEKRVVFYNGGEVVDRAAALRPVR